LAAAVVVETTPCQQAALLERREQLRDGRWRDGGSARQFRTDDLPLGDRLQGQVLGHRQRRVVPGK
jgi:hypothetical protein